MRNWGTMEDYTGMAYIREHIPAENDIPRKMKPEWGKLYYPNGELLYEGFMVDQMAYGAGTSYHPYGYICQQGLFGPNGLICGREYYNNGQIRFEGTFQYNAGFQVNWPIFGAFYDAEGHLKYYGAFDIIDEEGGDVRPYVLQPEDYGPLIDPIVSRHYDFRFRGEKARKYYRQETPAFREKYSRREKNKLRQMYGEEKIAARLREGLSSNYPEIRAFSAETLQEMGKWTGKDAEIFRKKQEEAASTGFIMTPLERYQRDCRSLDIPESTKQGFRKLLEEIPPAERNQTLMDFSKLVESMYPYKWGSDPRHYRYGKHLQEKGINPGNWDDHLSELTDQEIAYMQEQKFGVGCVLEERMVYPGTDVRAKAEFERAFGI